MIKKILLMGLLCLLAMGTVIPRVSPIKTHSPLVYKVSLDDPPIKRWKQVVTDFAVPLKKFIDYFDMLPIPETFFEGVEWFAKNVYQHKDFVA